jgi:hypothetical protein
MSTIIIPYTNIHASITKHFLEKEALSEGRAIEVKDVQWRALGYERNISEKSMKMNLPYIKEINGKYWLDEESLEIYYKKMNRIGFVIIAWLLAIWILFSIVIYYLIEFNII